MSNKQWFIIDNIDKLVESARILVYNNFGDSTNKDDELNIFISNLSTDELSEINTVLSQQECMVIAKNMIKTQKHKVTQEVRYIISEKKFMEMVESFNSRMVSNILHGLVSKDVLDTAYDEKLNDFVFWVKEENEDQEENKKPETD
jgi:hypothetical protein